MNPVLQLRNITRSYESPGKGPIEILKDINLELKSADRMAITGPSGSGKTTLLTIAGTLSRPDSGQVLIEGDDITALPERELALLRNQRLGFVFQAAQLLPQLSALENVLLPLLACNEKIPESGFAWAGELFERVGLGARREHLPGSLSGGERQRVAVLRALINRPRLVLADEPTGSLDNRLAGELAEMLVELQREIGFALVIVTHSPELAARTGNVMELKQGCLTGHGSDRQQ